VYPVPLDPGDSTALDLRVVNSKWRLLLTSVRRASPRESGYSQAALHRHCACVPRRDEIRVRTAGSAHPCEFTFHFASSPSLLVRASCNLARSAHPCEFTFLLRKFAEPSPSYPLQSCRVCSPLLAGSAHPCEFNFPLRKFAEPARSCLLQPCRVYSSVRVYFSASQVRRACSLVPLAALPGLLTRASLIFRFASSPSLLARAYCNLAGLAGSAHPCEFNFPLRKFAEPARSCLLQPCRVYSSVRVYFSASQVRRAYSLVHLATLPSLLTPASLLLCFASSLNLLPRATCNLAGSAHPCEFTFRLRKFAKPARSCILQPCRVCSLLRVFFSASQVRRACSLVPHTILPGLLTRGVYFSASKVRRVCSLVPLATLPGLLTRASLLFCFASSPSLLARASCNLAWSDHPCEFTFRLCKFAEPARSCLLQPCRVCSHVRVYFSASQVHRACSLLPIATLSGFLTHASLLFASQVRRACSLVHLATLPALPGLLTRASLIFRFASSPSLLARAACNLAGSAHPCEFTFRPRKFAEPARSCLMQPCRVCSAVQVYFSASQVRRACSLVPLAALPGLLTRASLLFHFASSPSLLARAYCNLAGSAHPCEFTSVLRKFAEPAPSSLLQPCRVCSLVRVYFSASQVRLACSLVPHTILPGLFTLASLLFGFASSPSLLARASCNLAGSAHLCVFTEPARSRLLQPCRVCSPVRVYFTLRKFAEPAPSCILQRCRSPSLLARAYCNLAGSTHPCEFTFPLRKFAEPARSCILQPCWVCSPVRVYFSASQVRRACSLVPHPILPGLLARATCNLAWSAHPCEFTFLLRKFAEPSPSCLLQPCRVCSPVRVYFSASQVRRACSLVPHPILLGLLTCASLLFCFESSPSLLALATCNLAWSTDQCEFTFLLRKFAEPVPLCLMQPCRVCSAVLVYFSSSQVRRACSLVPHKILPSLFTRASLLFGFASSPSLLARASCNLAGSAHLCEFTFPLRKFTEPARSFLLQPCRGCYPVRVYLSASKVRRVCSLVPLATLPGLLTRASLLFGFPSSPSLLARASCNLAGYAHPCEFTFPLRKFAEPARLCLLQPCRVCSPVRVYFYASQVRRACSLVPIATLPGLLTRASLLLCFASSPSLLAHASCNLAWSAHPCEFTFLLRKFAEPARLCLIQSCRVCSPERVYFSASQVRRVCSLVHLATLPGLLTPSSLLFCFASSPSLLACASYNLAGSAHPSEFTFRLRKFAESARSCILQPCRVCSPLRVYFSASQVRRACSLVPHTILPGLLTRASLLFGFASSPSLLARASCNLAGSAHPFEFTFLLRKFAEPSPSCLLQPCRVCSPVRVYSAASQVRRTSCNLAGSANPCEFTFRFRKFAEPASSCLMQPCWVCSPVSPSLLALAYCNPAGSVHPCEFTLRFASSPNLLPHASCNLAGSAHPCEYTFRVRKFAEPARSCLLQPCRV
ncbi:hypothetical protein CRG98_038327, partial [Punica granatum]